MENIGYIHSLESFGSADGPGVRYLIFFSGCNMRCRFCHNPDTWKCFSGEQMTADEILAKAVRYKSYWGKNGGITVSGGEPLLQIDFLIELFKKAKQQGINTCLDTSGEPFSMNEPFYSKFKEMCSVTDLFLLDIKHINEEKHIWLTGKSGKNILQMATELSNLGKKMWIRNVLLPTVNDSKEDLTRLAEFIKTLKTVEKVEVLPYHTFGVFKWENLELEYSLKDIKPPTEKQINSAQEILGIK